MVRAASCASPFRVLKILSAASISAGSDAAIQHTDRFVVESTDDGLERARVVDEGRSHALSSNRCLRSFGIRYPAPCHSFVGSSR